MTLVEFLLARIAEDEAVALAAREHEYLSTVRDASPLRWERDNKGYGTIFANSGRVLAECEAKRRIVGLHVQVDPTGVLYPSADPMCQTCHRDGDETDWPCATLQAIALPYADHPDYDEAWRP